jgi:hypothetical protein
MQKKDEKDKDIGFLPSGNGVPAIPLKLNIPGELQAVKHLAISIEELQKEKALAHLNEDELKQFADSLLNFSLSIYHILCNTETEGTTKTNITRAA